MIALKCAGRGVVEEVIEKEEVPYFSAPAPEVTERPLLDDTREAVLEAVKPSFDDSLKWTFSDGNSKLNADVEDKGFLERVGRQEISFSKGTVLRVRLQTKSAQTPSGLRTENKVVEVLEVIQPPPRFPLLEGLPESPDTQP